MKCARHREMYHHVDCGVLTTSSLPAGSAQHFFICPLPRVLPHVVHCPSLVVNRHITPRKKSVVANLLRQSPSIILGREACQMLLCSGPTKHRTCASSGILEQFIQEIQLYNSDRLLHMQGKKGGGKPKAEEDGLDNEERMR